MDRCTSACPDANARLPISFPDSKRDDQVVIKSTASIPPGISRITLVGEDHTFQHPDKISCKAGGEDLKLLSGSTDNGECLEFSITPRPTTIQTLSCMGPSSAFASGSRHFQYFCVQPSNTTSMPPPLITPSSPPPPALPSSSSLPTPPALPPPPSSLTSSTSSSSPLSSFILSSTIVPVTLSPILTITSNPTDLISLSDISIVTASSISLSLTLPSPPEAPRTNTTNTNKVTSKASQKGEVAGGVLGGIAIILIIFLLWRRHRRLQNSSTSHQEKAMTYRTSQRSSLWSSVPLTSSMLAEASKFDPTRMVKTGLPFDKNTPLAKNPTGGVHPLLPYP